MTRSVEIPEGAAEAAAQSFYGSLYGQGGAGGNGVMRDVAREAIAAALPYLVPAATCASVYRGRAGLEKCTLDPGHEDNHVGFRTVWTDEDSAALAGDGGLREALEKLAESYAETTHPAAHFAASDMRRLLAAHPAAPAVPQPVDREALIHGLPTWLTPTQAQEVSDAVLAVLAGEQEQVEP